VNDYQVQIQKEPGLYLVYEVNVDINVWLSELSGGPHIAASIWPCICLYMSCASCLYFRNKHGNNGKIEQKL